jgi:hypothetical protein
LATDEVREIAPSTQDLRNQMSAGDEFKGTSDTDVLGGDVSSMRAETNRHHTAVMGAPTLETMLADVTRHDDAMDEMAKRMGSHMNGVSHCAGSGMSMMQGKMNMMSAEMAGHGTAMHAATERDSARAACVQHTATMTDTLDGMEDVLGTMDCM